jgi:hypothetical protein
MAADEFRAAVFFTNQDEHRQAKDALAQIQPETVDAFSGVLEGWLTPVLADELVNQGLVVQVISKPSLPVSNEGAAKGLARAVEDLKLETQYVVLDATHGLEVRDSPVEEDALDPRIHPLGEYDADVPPDAQLQSDVYFIALTGPITEEQRLRFDSFDVDIGAFVPPNLYRTFLTREQYEQALKLPYVESITRVPFERVITPELVEVLSEEPAPSLLADDESPRRTFDALLYRERDREDLVRLLEQTQATHVVGASNLRVRFEAPLSRPLLAAIAALPVVRKLAPYEPPLLEPEALA